MKRFIIRSNYYYAIFIGILSVRFDFENRQFVESQSIKIYAFCVNALAIIVGPFALFYYYEQFDIAGDNQLMRITSAVTVVVQGIVITWTIIMRWPREQQLIVMFREMLDMEIDYFDAVRVRRATERRFNYLVFCKVSTSWFLSMAVFITMLHLRREKSFGSWLLTVYTINTQNIVQGVILHYYFFLWHQARSFAVLNDELHKLCTTRNELHACRVVLSRGSRTLQQLCCLLADDLHCIMRLHWQLGKLTVRLNSCYKLQILTFLLISLLNNIAVGYYAIMMMGVQEPQLQFNFAFTVFSMLTYTALLLDLYLLLLICEIAQEEYAGSAFLLKQLSELPALEQCSEHACELFSLQLMQHKLRICMGGLFVINKNLTFLMVSEMVRQSIILVQFDFENRAKWKNN